MFTGHDHENHHEQKENDQTILQEHFFHLINH